VARRLDVAEPAARVWHEPTDAALVAGSYTSVAQDETDTGGLELELATARTNAALVGSAASVVVPVPRRWSGDRIVAVFCPSAFTLEPGDTLAPDPGCVALAAR